MRNYKFIGWEEYINKKKIMNTKKKSKNTYKNTI